MGDFWSSVLGTTLGAFLGGCLWSMASQYGTRLVKLERHIGELAEVAKDMSIAGMTVSSAGMALEKRVEELEKRQ